VRLLASVALGGALGSAARWLLGGWVQRRAGESTGALALFPAGTLAVNLAGCFAIGLLATLFQERLAASGELRTFLLVGVLGGFTTFSAFGFETLALARAGNLALAAANVAASVGLGLAGVWLGVALARLL
jgi:CrcB protein